jgi:oxygen-independent coproporphyrinogen-3 oxidase
VNLGVYIQVPFCQSKCTYCNFHTGVFSQTMYAPYVEAVCREIGAGHECCVGNAGPVDTVYVGGGTPSLLEPAALSRILDALRAGYDCRWEEVTLEADPETITREKATAWRGAGFNRISMGVQSFQDNELKAAGRMHRRKDVGAAAGWLRDAGFANVSFDLIAGLPHQTEASWDDSVAQLIALRPEHVSVYLMEIDAGSRLGQEVLAGGGRYSAAALPAEDDMASFYEHACRALAGAGYEHYEISNWALPGRRSQHNLKYWKRQPYLGFGAGAHSFKGKQRWANVHDPAAYVAALQQGRDFREPMEMLTPRQQLDEELFLGLRLLEGIDVQRIEREYQVALGERLARLRADGLIEGEGPVVRLSPARLAISNEVFAELMQ